MALARAAAWSAAALAPPKRLAKKPGPEGAAGLGAGAARGVGAARGAGAALTAARGAGAALRRKHLDAR